MENNKIVKFVIKSYFRKQPGENATNTNDHKSIVHRGTRNRCRTCHVCFFKRNGFKFAPIRRLLIVTV